MERLLLIIEETELTLTVLVFPTKNLMTISKEEFHSSILQKSVDFVEKIPYSVLSSLCTLHSTADNLKNTYDDYYRRKQLALSGEF